MTSVNPVFVHRKITTTGFDPNFINEPGSLRDLLIFKSGSPIDEFQIGAHIPKTIFEKRLKSKRQRDEQGTDYSFVIVFDEAMIKRFGASTVFGIDGGGDKNLNQLIADGPQTGDKILSLDMGLPIYAEDQQLIKDHLLLLSETSEGNEPHREIIHCGAAAKNIIEGDLKQNSERTRDFRLFESYLGAYGINAKDKEK